MLAIETKNIEKHYGANKIFNDISFQINEKEKVAFVGQNGCGKTTLFKIINRTEEFTEGTLNIKKGLSVGYLDQIPTYVESYTALDVLRDAFNELYRLSKIMKEIEQKMSEIQGKELDVVMKEYADIQHTYETKGGYRIEEKINRVCNGLKFNDDFLNKNFMSLSGGEKTKVILGKILLEEPDILLLDEPTNHLDIDAVEWLENFIKEYSGTVLVISHDRYFLDKVVNKVIEIEDGKTETYNGNYSHYTEDKEKKLLDQLANYNSQQKEIKHMEDAIKRFKDWGHRSGGDERIFKKMRNMQKRIDRMEKIEKPKLEHAKMKLNFDETIRTGNEVIEVMDYCKAFSSNKLFEAAYMKLYHLDSAAIIGSNGCGKSTLIKSILYEYKSSQESRGPGVQKTITNEIFIRDLDLYKKDSGVIKLGTNIKLAYLDQNIHFINEEHTVLEEFRDNLYIDEKEARNVLAKFLFRKEDVFKKVKSLSGGEKTRLRLCQLIQHKINFLVLDEPTNHLDVDSKQVLEDALIDFEGTILFISHDRYFINKIANKIFEIADKKIICYEGNYDYYKSEKEKHAIERPANQFTKSKKISEDKKAYMNTVEERAKAKRKQSLEVNIHELENDIKKLDNELNNNGYNYEELQKIYKEKEQLQEKLDALLEEWIKI